MTRAKGFNVRIPEDVLSAAKARAASEHRSLADVIVRFLREYGQGRAGVPNEVPVMASVVAEEMLPAGTRLAPAGGRLEVVPVPEPERPARRRKARGPSEAEVAALRERALAADVEPVSDPAELARLSAESHMESVAAEAKRNRKAAQGGGCDHGYPDVKFIMGQRVCRKCDK